MQFLHEGQWVDVPEHIVDLIRRDERAKARERVANYCCICGPDTTTIYVCDECIAAANAAGGAE